REEPVPRVDRHGDPLPAAAVARLGTTRWRHSLRDYSGFGRLAMSPDGKSLVSAGDAGLRLWDAATGRRVGWLAVDTPGFKAARFTPDGRSLLTARLWVDRGRPGWLIEHREAGSGKVLKRLEVPIEMGLPRVPGSDFAQFSGDGRFF